MIVDYLRTGRRQWARLYRDRPDVLTRIRWYKALPGAQLLPIPHTFGFNVYDDPVRFENATAPGFLEAIDHFTHGLNHGQAGTHYHGQADWFLHGAPFGAVNPDGPCINWLGDFHGRLLLAATFEDSDYRGNVVMQGTFSDTVERYTGNAVLEGSYSDIVESFTGRFTLSGTWRDTVVFSGARAPISVSLAGESAVALAVLGTPEYDTDDYMGGGGGTTITAPFAGVFLIGAEVAAAFLGTPDFSASYSLGIIKNGATSVANGTESKVVTNDVFDAARAAVCEVELAEGDTITVEVSITTTTVSAEWEPDGFAWIEWRGTLP